MNVRRLRSDPFALHSKHSSVFEQKCDTLSFTRTLLINNGTSEIFTINRNQTKVAPNKVNSFMGCTPPHSLIFDEERTVRRHGCRVRRNDVHEYEHMWNLELTPFHRNDIPFLDTCSATHNERAPAAAVPTSWQAKNKSLDKLL